MSVGWNVAQGVISIRVRGVGAEAVPVIANLGETSRIVIFVSPMRSVRKVPALADPQGAPIILAVVRVVADGLHAFDSDTRRLKKDQQLGTKAATGRTVLQILPMRLHAAFIRSEYFPRVSTFFTTLNSYMRDGTPFFPSSPASMTVLSLQFGSQPPAQMQTKSASTCEPPRGTCMLAYLSMFY